MHLCPVSVALLLVFSLNNFKATSTLNNHAANLISQVSVNCGSTGTSAGINGREWVGDIQSKSPPFLQIKGSSTTSTLIHNSISARPIPHKTARISRSQFSYSFQVSPGQKILRLHFNPAPYKGFKRFKDLFSVEARPFTLLSNFSASLAAAALGVNSFAKEFCISTGEYQELIITFTPAITQSQDSSNTYAFINGIELISVPTHLSYFRGGDNVGPAQVVGQKSLVYIDNGTALELVHRLNAKRDSVSSGDDFDDMLGMWGTLPKSKANEIDNLTWKTPVDVGFRYLVRIHFGRNLGLRTAENGGLNFKVLINEMIVDTNTDILKERDDRSFPWYRDYTVAMKGKKEEGRRDLLICLQSYDEFMDGDTLRGFEIFKLSNPDNSLASPNALLPSKDTPSSTIQNLVSVLGHRNAIATVAITIISLINIIVFKIREIREAGTAEDENKPSARAERLCRYFSLAEIRSATKDFSEAFVIGKGGFGKVYKGLIDNGRETVAIKRLKSNSKQGRHEFLTEIETLSELRHINLVSLIGYCSERKEMILVYEYMTCGTLADHLYKLERGGNDCSSLTWKERLNICIGAARGLDYLHTGHGVIHRDVKTSNILLDKDFVPKVSDFGLAKPESKSKLQSHVSTKVKGTFGYFDPYYFSTHKLTRKSDTYAFGVVLLEVLCGRPALDQMVGEDEYLLTRWARNRINKGEVDQIVDTSLIGGISPHSLKLFVEVAETCLHDEPKKRPTMAQVVVQLEFALEQQENRTFSDDVCPSNEENVSSVSTKQLTVAPKDVHNREQTNTKIGNGDSPAAKEERRKSKIYKPLRFRTWDAFWNRVTPVKKRAHRSISGTWEEDIKLPKFDLNTIKAATKKFSSLHKIGEGGFGSVYKAVLPTGDVVAIKRFPYTGTATQEFKSQLRLASSLHHRNIVQVLGYCIHEGGILIYEFMENGSLDKFIFDEIRRHQLQWSTRFKIIIGVAKGVIYLHNEVELRIIHRDIKPTTILLDLEMNPKISGFGISRIFEDYESEVETRVAGTLAYISPEYAMRGRLSDKLDVYSFGVVTLEILSGRKNWEYPSYDLNLIDYAWELWKEEKALDLIDESIRGAVAEDEALRCIQVGLLCTQCEPHHRPTMPSVLKMLLGEDLSLQDKIIEAASHKATTQSDGSFNSTGTYTGASFLFPGAFKKDEDNGNLDSVNESAATFEYDSTPQR